MADAEAEIKIPKTYKAVVYDKPGTISTKVVELETPEPGMGEVLINLTHSGVCHSDLGIMTNSWPALPYPTPAGQVGGHEGVGKVVKLGPGCERSGVKVGARVGVKWVASICDNCAACREGHDANCFKQKISGYHHPGTFAQYLISSASYVTPIPACLPSQLAAPFLCAGLTAYSALRKSGARAGDQIAILGSGGGLGHIAVQLATRGMGLRVVAVDAESKRGISVASGAEAFVAHTAPDVVGAVRGASDGGVGVRAVLVLAGADAAYDGAVGMLRFGGRVVCVGVPEGEGKPVRGCVPVSVVARELSVVGCAVGGRREADEVLGFAARGVVEVRVREERMEGLTGVFEEMERGMLEGRVVLSLE
ncbi:GroES-like protein [Patellaria atrata CBS 101060]|uniref:GroES-like protein n=1 Tax=Patellaria atrata CBS 101060 TaxID=1346257 RepID=A0A9P4SBR6_9PEZI|nr:GroES-like protein [Patellaria atrata CBS 101060]